VNVLLVALLLAAPPGAGEELLAPANTPAAGRDASLYSIAGIALDRRNNVFVSDLLDYSVKKFDRRGAFIGRVGRRGNGPGEFRSPGLSAVVGERLVVLEREKRRIQVFDTRLRYAGEFAVQGGMPVDVVPDGRRGIAVALYSDTSCAMVLRYAAAEGGSPRRILLRPTGRVHPLYAAGRIAVSGDGTLVVAYLFMNRVDLYTPGGKYSGSFSIGSMTPPGRDIDDGRIPEETYFRKVLVDAAGNILLLGGSQSPHPGRDVFLCRKDGSLLRTFVLASRSRLIALGKPGALYATDETGTIVEKYSLR
jgi:hypothetical protein